jgi:hypothetical protein
MVLATLGISVCHANPDIDPFRNNRTGFRLGIDSVDFQGTVSWTTITNIHTVRGSSHTGMVVSKAYSTVYRASRLSSLPNESVLLKAIRNTWS